MRTHKGALLHHENVDLLHMLQLLVSEKALRLGSKRHPGTRNFPRHQTASVENGARLVAAARPYTSARTLRLYITMYQKPTESQWGAQNISHWIPRGDPLVPRASSMAVQWSLSHPAKASSLATTNKNKEAVFSCPTKQRSSNSLSHSCKN